jgi:hypothetical protein
MALSNEDLQQVENYLSGKGIHADTHASSPLDADKLLVIHEDGTGGYVNFYELANGLSVIDGKLNITYEKE